MKYEVLCHGSPRVEFQGVNGKQHKMLLKGPKCTNINTHLSAESNDLILETGLSTHFKGMVNAETHFSALRNQQKRAIERGRMENLEGEDN